MAAFRLTTPVALLLYNRPEKTRRVFAAIAGARPPKLLVVGDGPRADRPGDAEQVAATRAVIGRIDWDCEVLTNLSEVNLGCRRRVSSGIDWVFDRVESAVILEDDCLPDPTFFRFCQEMLERYRDDRRIGMISGDNFQSGRPRKDWSYYFSRNFHIWGWASWRDRWVGSYDVTLARWPGLRGGPWLAEFLGDRAEFAYWQRIFDRVHRGEIDAWDFQWVFANWIESRLSIAPAANLISNIGFGRDATHTRGASDVANLALAPLSFPLAHPPAVARDADADAFEFRRCFQVPIWKRARNRLAGWLQ